MAGDMSKTTTCDVQHIMTPSSSIKVKTRTPFFSLIVFVLFFAAQRLLSAGAQLGKVSLSKYRRMTQTRTETGFTMPEVLVSAGLGIVLTAATAATVAGSVAVMSDIEKNIIRSTLPTNVANKITEQVENADIIIPVNAMTNGVYGTSLFYNTELNLITSPAEGSCEYHSYFLSLPTASGSDPFTATLHHFVKRYTLEQGASAESVMAFSCMQYYEYIYNSATKRKKVLFPGQVSNGNHCENLGGDLLVGESCKVLLPRVYVDQPVFSYLRNDSQSLPQIKNGSGLKGELNEFNEGQSDPANRVVLPLGIDLPSFGVFSVPTTEPCTISATLQSAEAGALGEGGSDVSGIVRSLSLGFGRSAYQPGPEFTMVRTALTLPDSGGGSTTWSKDIFERYATPKYVALGGKAC